jgi:hypothetical protein
MKVHVNVEIKYVLHYECIHSPPHTLHYVIIGMSGFIHLSLILLLFYIYLINKRPMLLRND